MEDVERFTYLMFPLMLVAAPMAMIIRQPDLGTALLLAVSGVTVFFLAGVRLWVFVAAGIAAIGAIVPVWHLVLLDYQKARLLTYLRPEQDPLGSGYHVMQSKIALGSGGVFGKGFLAGSQSHLSFLPEKHTDFIFTMLAEEFGMMGGLTLIGLYAPSADLRVRDLTQVPSSFWPPVGNGDHDHVLSELFCERGHGNGPAACCWYASAFGILRRFRHADIDVRVWSVA